MSKIKYPKKDAVKKIRKSFNKLRSKKTTKQPLTKLDYIDVIKQDLEQRYFDSIDDNFGPDLELGKVLIDITKISMKYRKELIKELTKK